MAPGRGWGGRRETPAAVEGDDAEAG
jgi:hypothetical protein